jgi:hypothetical protein
VGNCLTSGKELMWRGPKARKPARLQYVSGVKTWRNKMRRIVEKTVMIVVMMMTGSVVGSSEMDPMRGTYEAGMLCSLGN